MELRELISAIRHKHAVMGITINPPASLSAIQTFEKKIGFELPADFREFYSICNGFGCTDDIFNITPLEEIMTYEKNYGKDWFHFAEYMIYSEMWSFRNKGNGAYEIFVQGDIEIVLTSSLHEFLERFLAGNIFDPGGLYNWYEELKGKSGMKSNS